MPANYSPFSKETDFIWYANTDIGFGTEENRIRTAYQSRLRQVLIGLEGVTAGELENLDPRNFKSRHAVHYSDYIERIQSNGIGVTAQLYRGQRRRISGHLGTAGGIHRQNTSLRGQYHGVYAVSRHPAVYADAAAGGNGCRTIGTSIPYVHPVMPFEKEDAGEWNRAYRRLLEKVNTGDIQSASSGIGWEIYKRGRGES